MQAGTRRGVGYPSSARSFAKLKLAQENVEAHHLRAFDRGRAAQDALLEQRIHISVNRPDDTSSDWLKPPEEQASLERYVETIRERLWLIIAIVAITTGVSILYVASATKTYEAEADLLVNPVSSGSTVMSSLGLIQASSDPTRDVETASRFVTNLEVARRASESIDLDESPTRLLKRVTAQPIAQSSLVAVTATAESPESAKQIADAFAQSVIDHRTQQMHEQIDEQLPRLQAEASADTGDVVGDASLESQITQLQVLRGTPDPTMRIESLAVLPTSQASPRPALSVAAGLFAGLVLGFAAAFVFQALDPRLRRESQIKRRYSIPILGRIPKEAGKIGESPIDPRSISPVVAEAYRTLRTTLVGASPRSEKGGKVIFVTGSAPSEGKTTTTINLATSLAVSGRRVVLIESDLRRPVIGKTLGATSRTGGVVSVLLENTTLAESLVQIDTYGPSLQLLLADYEGGWITELFSIPTAKEMIDQARQMADVVLIDSPPLNEVVDALPLAQQADDVLIVARLGISRLDRLERLSELLAENAIRPAGFAVVGTPRPKRSAYHYYAANRGLLSRQGEREGSSRGGSKTRSRQRAKGDRPRKSETRPATTPHSQSPPQRDD